MLFPLVIEILVPLTRQHCRFWAVLEGVAALGFQHPLVIEILVPLTRQHCRFWAVLEGVAALGFQHLRNSNYTIANNITGGLPLSVAMSLILMKFDLLFLND